MMGLADRCGSPSWLEGDDSLRLWVLGQRPTVSHLFPCQHALLEGLWGVNQLC